MGTRRYHALDSLRGSMMMLGLVIHTAMAYTRTPSGELWGYKDPQTHMAFDVIVAFLHTFRMPVFFVIAGFFAAMVVDERGEGGLVRNRARRVLAPLVIGWVVLFPVTIAGFAFARLGGTFAHVIGAIRYAASASVVQHLQLLHLWFLLDLLIYYAAALVIGRLSGMVSPAIRAGIAVGFESVLRRWYGPIALALVTFVTLLPMRSGMLETPGTFRRPVATLAANGVFFAFGWLLYLRRELLPNLEPLAWGRTLAACVLFPVHGLALVRLGHQPSALAHAVAISSLAALTWLFVFGLIGLFMRYLSKPSATGRYLADASYWFYLLHLPLVAWGTGLVGGLPWPAGTKYAVVLSAVAAICWTSYNFAVRPTFIGAFLNGRRYPRGLPLPPES